MRAERHILRVQNKGADGSDTEIEEEEMEIEADNNGYADHAQDNVDVGSGGGEPYKGLDGDLYYKKAGRAYRQESHERVGFLASKVRFKLS